MSFILTFVASDASMPLEKNFFNQVQGLLKHENIAFTCEPIWLDDDRLAAADIGVSDKPSVGMMARLRDALKDTKIDILVTSIENRRKKLLIADMDSTIVKGETLDDLAAYAGVGEKVAAITARAMNGEIDFETALRERVGLLRDLPESVIEKTLQAMEINPGARELVGVMKAHKTFCVLVSGGFSQFTGAAARQVGFLVHHGNGLIIEKGVLTGKVKTPVLDKQSKVNFMKHYLQELSLKPAQCMAIGDGANDLPMLKMAGLGIGYKPKPVVAEALHNVIVHGDLKVALFAQGYRAEDMRPRPKS